MPCCKNKDVSASKVEGMSIVSSDKEYRTLKIGFLLEWLGYACGYFAFD
jgi:hypothetical protein